MSASSSRDFFQLVLNDLRDKAQGDPWLKTLDTGFSALIFEGIFPTYFELRLFLKQQSGENLCGRVEGFEPRLFEIVQAVAKPPVLESTLKVRQLYLQLEHPEVHPDTDDDIVKYFRARFEKRLDAARNLYSNLTFKYPEPESRATLLRWYRTGSPLFSFLYEPLKAELAERALESVRRTIFFILKCFGTGPRGKSWTVLEPIRAAMRALPSARSEAARVLDRLRSYSQAGNWHVQEFGSVCDVLEAYLGDHLFDRKEIRLVLPKSFSEETRARPQAKVVTINVASVSFSEKDLKEILINPKIQGVENIALTYCWQYWLKVEDPVFENKISLYSARYHGPHLTIFRLIKEGQASQVKDDEILYSVYNLVARDGPYEYNVRKDIYMQTIWRRIKPGIVKPVIEDTRAYAEELIEKEKKERIGRRLRAGIEVDRQRKERIENRRLAAEAVSRMQKEEAQSRALAEAKVAAFREEGKRRKERIAEKARLATRPVSSSSIGAAWTKYDGTELDVVPLRDRVNALSNGQGKNVHVIFRSRLEEVVQDFVRNFVERNGLEVKNVQKTLTVLAIKDFLQNSYESNRRSWMLSNERLKVKELGLDIEDVEPIVEDCLLRLTNPVSV